MSTSAPHVGGSPPARQLTLPWIGFARNDPDYAPFGMGWLRGVTPMRLGLFLGLCILHQLRVYIGDVASGVGWGVIWAIVMAYARWLPMLVLIIQSEARTSEWAPIPRVGTLAAAIAAGAAISQTLGVMTMAYLSASPYRTLRLPGEAIDPLIPRLAISGFFTLAFYGGILTAVLVLERRARATEQAILDARMARVALERQAVEAQLRLLDAQIEPHFMFNTLATAKRMCESEPAQGRALLRDLVAYLREAAPLSRVRETTLAEEAALAWSLLGIFKVRMGERLRFAIDIPAELGGARIPPLMLGTLVENAIKHGIAPRASGGEVRITARRLDDALEIDVADNGVGFQSQSGHGVGLANVRARLRTLFGTGGTLILGRNRDGGITVTLRLPYRADNETLP